MDASSYATLSRQSGLIKEMQVVANNIANASTTGYRAGGLVFSEYIKGDGDGAISMGHAGARMTDLAQGPLTRTEGTFDLAIEGDGFFLVQTPDGPRLTRAGAFTPNGEGLLSTAEGHQVLDAGEAPIFVPAEADGIHIASDGTISAGGQPLGQIGVFLPNDPQAMSRARGVLFDAPGGYEGAPDARVMQGVLEGSNVNAIEQITRMIEVQRAYEMGQSFLETEDERIRAAVKTMIK
ncbi:flagellar hook-basal body complex protein [Marinibacterium profundimaris]|uniref:Flagellar basal-body rod protein FlgF n=1 Tax=Marinibacterium profundimaris TaxID=1679460 RepID=A0A225NS35_9RHOB|nr:flagellar hook-basal body complex protein [Marinibacterium profundimaris]OWU75857.1 flagellar basal body rod protein FlgF [Marinibacterium profundimaris]